MSENNITTERLKQIQKMNPSSFAEWLFGTKLPLYQKIYLNARHIITKPFKRNCCNPNDEAIFGETVLQSKLREVEWLKDYMGGDNEDKPVNPESIGHMKYIVEQCNAYGIPYPHIAAWAGGNGVDASWRYDWHIEISSSDKWILMLMVREKDYDNVIQCRPCDIKSAFLLAKEFIMNVVDVKGSRD